ncbi:MAG: hypothetical protein ACODAD_01340 [Planctomycetota bacterium]
MTQSGEPFDPYYHWLGIPPDEQPPNHYRLLGIKLFESNRSVIQNAADRQMAHLRSFQAGPHGPASQKLLNEVSGARICLLSAEKKAAYDAQLDVPGASSVPPPAAAPPAVSTDGVREEGNSPGSRVAAPVVRSHGSISANRQLSRRRGSRAAARLLRVGLVLTATAAAAAVLMRFERPATAPNRLVLNWPAAQRPDATIEIDGQKVDLSKAALTTAETVELELEPGSHEYRISHPRSEPLVGQFVLPPEERVKLDVVLNLAPKTEVAGKVELVLVWPESERRNHALEIDGRPRDLTDDAVKRAGDEVRVLLSPGPHTVALVHNGERRLQRVVDVGKENRIFLSRSPSLGMLRLEWSPENRGEYRLLLDGEVLDPGDADNNADGRILSYEVSSGTRKLELYRGESPLRARRIEIAPQEFRSINIDAIIDQAVCQIALQWPLEQREGAQLEINGKQHDIATALAADSQDADSKDVVIDVEPGEHTIRIARPGYEVFERTVTVVRGTHVVEVDLKHIVSMTMDDKRYEQLRDEYRVKYTQFDEYRNWNQKQATAQKKQALGDLLDRMSVEAERMEPRSEQQYIAYEAAYRLAAEQTALIRALSILDQLRSSRCISESEQSKRKQELWETAIYDADLSTTQAFFGRVNTATQELTLEEMRTLGKRIAESMTPEDNYESWEQKVRFFQDRGLLTPLGANETRARLLLKKGAHASRLPPPRVIGLVEKMLEVMPELLGQGTEEALSISYELLDTAQECQRLLIRATRKSISLKSLRLLGNLTQERKELVTRYRHIVKARKSIAAGRGTAAEHKLVGLWRLERSQYEEALSHLRQSDDPPLVAIAKPVPETERERAGLVADIEAEAKKTKYQAIQKAALKAYATYIQQLD